MKLDALFLIKYGEIALKGKNRTFFINKLKNNIKAQLKDSGVEDSVIHEVLGLSEISRVKRVAGKMKEIANAAINCVRHS